jgi:hypothetical protein
LFAPLPLKSGDARPKRNLRRVSHGLVFIFALIVAIAVCIGLIVRIRFNGSSDLSLSG